MNTSDVSNVIHIFNHFYPTLRKYFSKIFGEEKLDYTIIKGKNQQKTVK